MAESFVFNVRLADEHGNTTELHCTEKDTELYMFGGAWKAADHFFHRFDRTQTAGAFLWRAVLGSDQFDEIANRVIESERYTYHFAPQPTGMDLHYFLEYEASDVVGVPEDWA